MTDPNVLRAWEEAYEEWKLWRRMNLTLDAGEREITPCAAAFNDDLATRLNACSHEFFLACNFAPIVMKCPGFDPAMKAFEWEREQGAESIKTLATRVKALEAKLGTNK